MTDSLQPMDYSMSGFSVLHDLSVFTQTHVQSSHPMMPSNRDAIQSSHPLSLLSPLALNLSEHHSLFQWISSSLKGLISTGHISFYFLWINPWCKVARRIYLYHLYDAVGIDLAFGKKNVVVIDILSKVELMKQGFRQQTCAKSDLATGWGMLD